MVHGLHGHNGVFARLLVEEGIRREPGYATILLHSLKDRIVVVILCNPGLVHLYFVQVCNRRIRIKRDTIDNLWSS